VPSGTWQSAADAGWKIRCSSRGDYIGDRTCQIAEAVGASSGDAVAVDHTAAVAPTVPSLAESCRRNPVT
jgi:hypothetical protein